MNMNIRKYGIGLGLALVMVMSAGAAHAQSTSAATQSADLDLPDAPQAQSQAQTGGSTGATAQPANGGSAGTTRAMADTEGAKAHVRHHRDIAPKYSFYIPDDQKSVPLTNGDKWKLVGVQSVNGFTFTTAIIAASWEQIINGNPKYGTDAGAYGQRLGAAYIRQSSQAFFQEAVGDTLLHDDPRYYIMGRNHSFVHRFAYAATRVVSTRSDNGDQKPNLPLIFGYLGASALTQAYYPAASRGAGPVFEGWALSLSAAGLGFEFHEFFGDGLRLVHLKKD
jgi:hypothetical protein